MRQKQVGILYNGFKLDLGFRADFIVDDKLIIEIKSVEEIGPVHFKQVLTYLRFSNLRLGLLVNFNVGLIKNGIQRVVNRLYPWSGTKHAFAFFAPLRAHLFLIPSYTIF